MRVLVTGGTGLLGNNIIRQLSDAKIECCAIVRKQPRAEVFADTHADFAFADLAQLDQAEQAAVVDRCVAQCDVIIHCAAIIHLGWTRLSESMRVNRDGTRFLVEAAIRHHKRFIHIGTVDTLALGRRDQLASEDTPLGYGGREVPCNYVLSKRASVAEVRRGVERGLQAVVLHPGFMLGPWDWAPSSGRMLVELSQGWTPVFPTGGCSVCDARDVAATAVRCLTAGGDQGREYILAGVNWTYRQLWSEICQRFGRPQPRIAIIPPARLLVGKIGDWWAAVRKKESDVNSAMLNMSAQWHWYDSSRARQELNYSNRPPAQTLDDAVDFIRRFHLV